MVDRNLLDRFEEDLIKGKPVSPEKLLKEGVMIDEETLAELHAIYFLYSSMKKVRIPSGFDDRQRVAVRSLIASQLSIKRSKSKYTDEYETLGQHIAEARQKNKIRVRSFAAKIGVREEEYRKLEVDRLDPVPTSVLRKICDILHLSMDKLSRLSTIRPNGFTVSPSFARKSGKKKKKRNSKKKD